MILLALAAQVQAASPVQSGLSTWQFVMAVAVTPVATLVVLLWTWSMNNRRADQVKMELTKSIGDLGSRITELKADLSVTIDKTGGRVTELKTDTNAQMSSLKADINGQLSGLKVDGAAQASQLRADVQTIKAELAIQGSQLRSDVQAIKSDVKEWVKTEMEAGFSRVRLQMLEHQGELLQKLERLPPTAARLSPSQADAAAPGTAH